MKISVILWTFLSVFFFNGEVRSQTISQMIRGTITDQDSGFPLIGATVVVVGTDPVLGAVTDVDGQFRIGEVPIGRVTLKITYVGYEDNYIRNVLIDAAKEMILNVSLTESVNTLNEIVVTAGPAKGEALNEMAISSAHTFSVEETQRYAGSFDDPARMVSAFAGVNVNADGFNDIIVRGNSPKGILWRLEGVAIPNPNHFAGEGSTGGPINSLSSKMLGNSDFFTGAFAPAYGNVTSGVFDMRLKGGNNEQKEYTAAFSTLGIDVTAEGPFREDHRGSYIANYRYSALDLLSQAGVVDFGGVPRYQDMSFKVRLPSGNRHSFSMFGLGGLSGIDSEEEEDDVVYGKYKGRYKVGVIGLTHTFQINKAMYLESTLAATGSSNAYNYRIPDDEQNFYTIEDGEISKSSLIAASTFNYKLNARHKIESGIILTELRYNMQADEWNFDNDVLANELMDQGRSSAFQAFTSWKYRISDEFTMVNGLHYLQFALNNNYSIEPRVAMKWQFTERESLDAAFGLHSSLEGMSTYMARNYEEGDPFTQPNKDLEITKAVHAVLGYGNRLGPNTHLKIEAYYQYLYDVPVEDNPASAFSMLNESEGYTTRQLVNDGTGRNYGLELTLERYLYNGLYYMGTASLFRSFYTPRDGVERKSAFDSNYVLNLVGGKEFGVGNPAKNKVFFINTKIAMIGGKRYSPIDLDASIAKGTEVTDELHPFSQKGDAIFRADLAIGLRRNRKRTTTELKIDIQNIFNNQTVLGEYYINALETIKNNTQQGLLPNISYKVSF